MSLEHSSPHLATCTCGICQATRAEEQRNTPDPTPAIMSRDRKDYFTEDTSRNNSDSDQDRTRKDERIRQAPYLPRIQVWARDNGPYTLRVGHQWFHCDDLLINGNEYRSQAKKPTSSQPTTPSSAATTNRRTPLNRAQSYQRTRPASRPTTALARQASRDKVERQARYESQALPEPRRKHISKKSSSRGPKETESTPPPSAPLDATTGSLVPYKPPTDDQPAPTYQEPKQSRPALRPGRLSRGNSYQIPVRSKGRKAVKFAPLPN